MAAGAAAEVALGVVLKAAAAAVGAVGTRLGVSAPADLPVLGG